MQMILLMPLMSQALMLDTVVLQVVEIHKLRERILKLDYNNNYQDVDGSSSRITVLNILPSGGIPTIIGIHKANSIKCFSFLVK